MKAKMLLSVCACFILGVCLSPLAAQPEMPKPGPQHEMLKKFEGKWDATVSFMGGESKGTTDNKIGLGGFWLTTHFKSDFGGGPFEGRGTIGYDPMKKKYVSTWVDSMAPWLTVMQGNFDKEGDVYTETGEGPGMDGKIHKIKSVHEFKGKDMIVFNMYQVDNGKEQKTLQITYKRQK